MNKTKLLFDNVKDIDDRASVLRTDITIKNSETGEVLFERLHNKVIISGAAFTAARHFNVTPAALTPSYNTILGLENSVTEVVEQAAEKVFLFAVGTDGCGVSDKDVYPVDYTKWIAPEALVPFRYQLDSNDLGTFLRDKYYGRKVIGNRIAYYFKAFEAEPVFKQQYIDGTPIDENIFTSTRTDEVESYVEVILKITKEDCRDFFKCTTGIEDARVNTISLLTAWKKDIDGITYFQDIRPLTKLNFGNETLIDETKGLDIIYHIYY